MEVESMVKARLPADLKMPLILFQDKRESEIFTQTEGPSYQNLNGPN